MRLKRIGTIAIDEVLPYVVMEKPRHGKEFVRERPQRIYLDKTVHMDSLRYQCFVNSGIVCVNCGLKGEYFALEQAYNPKKPIKSERFHLNLYAITDDSREVMFTKDHILARSRGGSNAINNLQTMCAPCNTAKGNFYDAKIDPGFARTGRTSRNRVRKLKWKCIRELEKNRKQRKTMSKLESLAEIQSLKKRHLQVQHRLTILTAIDRQIKERLAAQRASYFDQNIFDRRMRIHNLRGRVEAEISRNKQVRGRYYQPRTADGGPKFVAMKQRFKVLKKRLELLTRLAHSSKEEMRKKQRDHQEKGSATG